MSQYRPCIPEKCLAAIKLFHKIEARLWKCYYVTIKKLHFTFFTKVMNKIRITMVNVLTYYITSQYFDFFHKISVKLVPVFHPLSLSRQQRVAGKTLKIFIILVFIDISFIIG